MRQIALVADNEPTWPHTNSGVALGILNALRRRSDLEVVAAVGTQAGPIARAILLVLTARLPIHRWRLATRRGVLSRWLRSLTRSIRLRRKNIPDAALVLHVRNIYRPTPRPYAAFIDTTVIASAAEWNGWERPIKSLTHFEERYYRKAIAVFVAGRAAARSLVRDYGVDESKIAVVGGGTNYIVDRNLLKVRAERASAPVQVLFVGKEFTRKGGDILIQALESLASEGVSLEVVIVGCSPAIRSPRVRVVGRVDDRSALWQAYVEADIFCLPARHEPYGLVVQEAMAAALPVVVSSVGELPAIVQHGQTGFVTDGSVGEVVDALRVLATDRELRRRLGKAAMERASEHLTWDSVAERMVQHLSKLAAKGDVTALDFS